MRRAVVVLLLPMVAACGTASAGTASSSPSAQPSTAVASTVVPTTAAATVPDGSPDAAFRVAPPLLAMGSGGAAVAEQPPCTLKQVTATAVTRVASGGVVGVIRLMGHHCSLPVPVGPTAVLDAHGEALDVRLDATPPLANAAQNWRPDIPLTYGNALWGFAWRGSWCGSPATSIVVPMINNSPTAARHPYLSVIASLTGPAPPCSGSSDAVLQPGVAGAPADAGGQQPADGVLPAPPTWGGLRASLRLTQRASAAHVSDATLTLTNTTGEPIALSPCPDYAIEVGLLNRDFYGIVALPCPRQATIDASGGTLTLDVPVAAYTKGLPALRAGDVISVQVAIAGVPTATATTRVGP